MLKFSNSKYDDIIYPVLVWIAFFVILLPFYNLGFDLTDEGWQLAKSWGILHDDFQKNADLIWGSSFLNGLWMQLNNKPLLLWPRIGYLVFLPFFGTVIYLMLKEFYPRKYVFLSVVTAFLLFKKTFIIYSSINYYYLPVFASLLSFLFLIKFHKSEKYSYKYLILSGIFAGICIHLKFTYILIIPILLIYFISFRENNLKFKPAVYFYSSFSGTVLMGFLFLYFFGGAGDLVYGHERLSILDMFGYFFGTSTVNSSLNYSAGNLLSIYFNNLISVLNYFMIPLIIFSFGSYSSKRFTKMYPVIVLVSGILLYFFIFYTGSESHLKLIGTIFVVAISIILSAQRNSKDIYFLYYIFISAFALSFLGSGMGFYTGLFSLGFFGFSAMALTEASTINSDKVNTKIILPAFIILALITQFSKSYSPYRDLPSEYLNVEFKSPELIGIYSFKERVDVVDEFLDFAKKENIRSQKVIFVAMPMFYYLLDVKPVISETHDVILGFDQLKKEVIEADPNIIVIPVQSPRGQLWPLPQNADRWIKDGFERQTANYYKFYNEYIAANNFQKIFENKMFIVYRKTELLKEEIQP